MVNARSAFDLGASTPAGDAALLEASEKVRDGLSYDVTEAEFDAIRALVRHHDAEEGEGWAVRLAGVDEMLMVSRRQVAAVREALGE